MDGEVIRLKDHPLTSAGRSTRSGQAASAGQFSENHRITSSYLRAVKVLPSSSSRSKKRQSPAASRPMVAKLTKRASAYAEAQAMRFDRNSVSMASEDSRNFPTPQGLIVGNFPLAQPTEKSDKSAMANVDQIRRALRVGLEAKSVGAVALATALGLDRTYISDFIRGKKRSLGIAETAAIADALEIPAKELTPDLERGIASIRKGARPHLYVREHMDARGWDIEHLADRMDTDAKTVSKWLAAPQEWQVPALLHAFGMENVTELARLPRAAARPPKPKVARRRA